MVAVDREMISRRITKSVLEVRNAEKPTKQYYGAKEAL